jgi:hypothetical protein
LTAEHLEAQADARATEATQLPEGEARQNALRNAVQLRVYASMKRALAPQTAKSKSQTRRMESYALSDYRAYIIGPDGHLYETVALDAPDGAAAIEAAKQLVEDHEVELWQLDRKIRKFKQEKK